MKKHLSLLVVLACITINYAGAQTLTVNGRVKDQYGNGIALAMVQDKGDKTAVRTDTAGKFQLKVNPNAALLVISDGFDPKVVRVKDASNVQIVLTANVDTSGNSTAAQTQGGGSVYNDITAYNGTSNSMLYDHNNYGAALPSFHPTEATRGSRYLFPDWVPGFVVSSKDSVYKNPAFGFNYDKIQGTLYFTQDKRTSILLDNTQIKSFTLYNHNQPEVFEFVPEVNKSYFIQVIEEGKKYKIYKLLKTTFTKNDFHTDGMSSTGNNYDEYVDEYTYYVYDAEAKQVKVFTPKKKSIKAALASEKDKVDQFMDNYPGDIDDTYLKNLGDFLNQ